MMKMNWIAAAAVGLLLSVSVQASEGSRWSEGIGFYVGVDSQSVIASGTFAGLANPNANRLTLLLDHGNHYHGIGSYSYSGTAQAPVVQSTNANNRLPELYSRTDEASSALALKQGGGAMAGKWVSSVLPEGTPAADYSYLGMASVQSLDGLSSEADVLFHSSRDRWSADFNGVKVGLKLESASAGLKVANGNALDIFGGGSVYEIGSSKSFTFLPTFYVDQGAAAGTYSAQFSLVNLGTNNNVRQGGSYYIDFAVPTAPVPEPQTWALLGAGLLAIGMLQRRRKSA